ncbi:MAG: HIT family protein [Gammaproteobacteria bacterium]|nr:HIT family protein [Gammaproteobacteria bacterium]
MTEFLIDETLKNDCHMLGRIQNCYLMLMDNTELPWFILVPVTTETEYYRLSDIEQLEINNAINWISEFLVREYRPDKINVASIGNVVKQMHIHVVGRFETDYCWPGVVWGVEVNSPYYSEQVDEIRKRIKVQLQELFEEIA